LELGHQNIIQIGLIEYELKGNFAKYLRETTSDVLMELYGLDSRGSLTFKSIWE
jgi:hypothetical protein